MSYIHFYLSNGLQIPNWTCETHGDLQQMRFSASDVTVSLVEKRWTATKQPVSGFLSFVLG